ncbi:MAG: prepilin-type cleavage/methylation domain-containing protein [Meiothermus sp.]
MSGGYRQAGLSFIEVVVALSILGVVLVGVVPSFLSYMELNTRSEQRSNAVRLVEERLEALRLVNPQTLPTAGSQDSIQTRNGRAYTVRTTYCAEASLCNSGSRHIRVEVFLNGRNIYAAETVFTQLR